MFGGKTCHVCTQLEHVFSSCVHTHGRGHKKSMTSKFDVIVTQKLIEVLNSFSLSSSARQPSLNMRGYWLCDLTGPHCSVFKSKMI